MAFRDDAINASAYFFEVLVKNFLEVEKAIKKESGILSIFKRINYMDRAEGFGKLKELAQDAKQSMPYINNSESDVLAYSLATKLMECFSIYINMVDSQVNINIALHQRANNEKPSTSEKYMDSVRYGESLRKSLEVELPKLQSMYAAILSDEQPTEEQRKFKETDIADIVIDGYIKSLNQNFDTIRKELREMGFEDLLDDGQLWAEIFICGVSIDCMALYNLLGADQATRIMNYICSKKFRKSQVEYSIDKVLRYKNLWDKALAVNDVPLDFVFSLLIDSIVSSEKKYSASPLDMMKIMSLVMPVFAGRWKLAIDTYNMTA